MDRHYDASGVLLVDPDGVVTANKLELEGGEHRVEFLVPLMSCLFQAIQRFVKLENRTRSKTIPESLWLLHVDVMIEFPIQKRIGDVQGVKFQVLNSSKSEDGSQCSPSGSGSEDLAEIESRTLREAFGNKPGLVAVD